MSSDRIEIYHPRAILDLGVRDAGSLRVKVYGLLAPGKEITAEMVEQAEGILRRDVPPRVAELGDNNGLGFVIIHPGDLGISISFHWWIQGSVLCQHIHRQLYGAREPMETLTRPVVGCVWELALINAEQEAWRGTMMTPRPDPAAYLASRAAFEAA